MTPDFWGDIILCIYTRDDIEQLSKFMTRRTQYSVSSPSGLKYLPNMPTCFFYWILVNLESTGFDIIVSSICHQNSELQRKAKFWLCGNIVESIIACGRWVITFFFFPFFATLVFLERGLCVVCCCYDIYCGNIWTKLFLRPLKFLTKYFIKDWGNTWNKEKEVGMFFAWLPRLLMTEFHTTFPTILCIFPSLLQLVPSTSEKASSFTLQKICSHFYSVPTLSPLPLFLLGLLHHSDLSSSLYESTVE